MPDAIASRLSRRALLRGGVAVAVLAPVMAACGTPPPAATFADLRWTHRQPLLLGVRGIEVVRQYQSPGRDPNVEHLMPISPEKAAETWVADRLQSNGVGLERMRVVIEDASVVEVPLETKKGVTGFFTSEPDLRYEAKLTIAVQRVDDAGQVTGSVRQTAWRTKTLTEKASLADREKAWFELVEGLMKDLDPALESGIRENFTDLLLRR